MKRDPYLYDTWFDYVRLEEEALGDEADEIDEPQIARVREVYERAIANVPPAPDKRLWRRYIYLWLRYSVFEELTAKDGERARMVLAESRKVVPHGSFTFAKLCVRLHPHTPRGRAAPGRRPCRPLP